MYKIILVAVLKYNIVTMSMLYIWTHKITSIKKITLFWVFKKTVY